MYTFLSSDMQRDEALEKMLSWSLVLALDTAPARDDAGPPTVSWFSRGTVPSSGTA